MRFQTAQVASCHGRDIYPLKPRVGKRGGEHLSDLTRGTASQGAVTGNNRVACVIGSCFNSSLVGLWFVQDVYIE